MSEPLLGDPDDLRKILEAVDAKNEIAERQVQAAERLATVVDELHSEIVGLRGQIHDRPTQASVEHKRRRATAGLILFGIVLLFAGDHHSENCGPGARAEPVIVAFVDADQRGITTREELAAVFQRDSAPICDVAFPLHSHDEDRWPSGWALIGLSLYGLVGAVVYLWQRHPNRGRRADDPPAPEKES